MRFAIRPIKTFSIGKIEFPHEICEEINNHIAGITALGRVGLPQDIGGVVAFLCTEEARWINGQRIEVSGGMMV